MTGEPIENVTRTFKFSFPTCSNENVLFNLEVPVEIPHPGSTRELVQRVLGMFHIPVYLEDELNEKLAKFVEDETKIFHDERDEKLLNQLKNGELNVDAIVKDWEKLFKENVVDFAEQKGTSDEEVFAAAYHKLVHSPALETILQVENSYAKTVMETLKSRDDDINKLTQRQTEEMEEKVRQLNTFTTEADINELATTHFEEQSLSQGRWASQLDALGRAQKHELRNWLMNTLEEYQSTSALNTPSSSPLASFPAAPLSAPTPKPRALDESYTIHLGSQLKHTHNIRLISRDPLELCSCEHVDNPAEASRRLQTALGLYSSELSAVVLVSDGPRSHITQQLARAAKMSTDYHFPDYDAQMQTILMRLNEPLEERQKGSKRLQTGDVLITRHSNLSDSHVVFHLIADDAVATGDITSRHPAMLGLRNILRAATQNDVTALAIPLLLTHELAEGVTAAWSLRRAELVLKCVKGFMVEAAGGGGAALRTLILCAPPALAAPAAAALAALPPNTFTVTTPLNFKAPT